MNKRWIELLEELTFQRQCIDMMNASWLGDYKSHGGAIYCARGCHKCCSLTVNSTLTEAVAMANSLDEKQLEAISTYVLRLKSLMSTVSDLKGYLQMQRRDMGMCPLLDEYGACGGYASRPLSCRSLLSTKDSYWCGVDFSTLSTVDKEQYIASLDQSVAAFPLHYVASSQDTGKELETRQLTHMQELFGFSCYGCMPVLVSLVHRHALAGAESRLAAEQLVETAGFGNPLLVTFLP